jgi:DNA-binding transcriptional MocR family regulator
MVNHKDNSFMLGLQKMNIRRGQTWTSIDKLCKRWSWGRDRVSRYLNLLENEGMIYQERTNRGLLITVVNYGFFQDFKVDTRQPTRQPIEQPIRHQANIKTDSKPDSQSHINNNDKNDNKNDVNNENKNEKKPAAHSDFCGGVVYEE